MNVENLKETIKSQDGLSNTLGMEFISTPEPDTLQATMKVDNRNKQVFGFLSGGASLALCPGKISVGINVNGTHVKAVSYGSTVTAYGRLLHKGRTLHTWHIDIKDETGDLISTVQVTNYVLSPRAK